MNFGSPDVIVNGTETWNDTYANFAATTPGAAISWGRRFSPFLGGNVDFTMYQYFGDKADGNVLSSTEVQDAEAEVCLDRRRCWTTPAAFLAIAIFGAAWIATVLLTGCSSVEKPPEATAQVSGPSRRTETGGLGVISLLHSVSPGRRRSTERGDSDL